jgi:CheY-like chemotaxis protein
MPRVLWIEADATHALLLRLSLRSLGVFAEFETIRDGKRALERLRALCSAPLPEQPELLVLDCEELGPDAYEMLSFLDAQPTFEHTPTVVLAASQEAAGRARRANTSFQRKPATLGEIKDLAGRLCAVLSTRSFFNREDAIC